MLFYVPASRLAGRPEGIFVTTRFMLADAPSPADRMRDTFVFVEPFRWGGYRADPDAYREPRQRDPLHGSMPPYWATRANHRLPYWYTGEDSDGPTFIIVCPD